jgi:hypothetical protein
MKTIFYAVIIAVIISASFTHAAKLQISENAQGYITSSMNKTAYSLSYNLSSSAITGTEKSDGRLIVFEVIKANKSDSMMRYLSRNVRLPGDVVFNSLKGAYSYNNISLQNVALRSTTIQDLSNLKIKATRTLEQLIGTAQAKQFVSANEETDYVKENDADEERILRKTYRFTRKLNGRHILDNTSFVRLSFSADQELCGFEIVNPVIKPVRYVERPIKAEATINRLGEYAAEKLSAEKNGSQGIERVGVTVINAEKGFDTYLSKKSGDKTLLIPNVSFYSDYQLENGEHFKNWSHFCLDADYVPDIDANLIESSR